MEKIKSLRVPTALGWLVGGWILAQVLNGLTIIPAVASPKNVVAMAAMWVLTFVIAGGLAYELQRKNHSVFGKIHWRSVLIVVIAFVLLTAYGNLIAHFFPSVDPQNQVDLDNIVKKLSGVNYILFQSTTVILAPLIEDVIFRGWMVCALSTWHKVFQFVIPTVLFALGHAPATWVEWAIYGGMGAAFMAVRMLTGKVQYSMAMHMVWNFLAVVAS
ncbi:type II CAAX endopeptidase family protein [Lactobacillaceae bacterium L1_55_11]|nr:type II CAAX endopeptidase family protein [Lactobacillaceae bacterium L1_55_11]